MTDVQIPPPPADALDSEVSKRGDIVFAGLAKGAGILLISSYLPEVYELSDTLHVFRRGRLVASHGFRAASHEDVLTQAIG